MHINYSDMLYFTKPGLYNTNMQKMKVLGRKDPLGGDPEWRLQFEVGYSGQTSLKR